MKEFEYKHILHDNQVQGIPEIDNAHWITELFTSMIPGVHFVCYEKNWCSKRF